MCSPIGVSTVLSTSVLAFIRIWFISAGLFDKSTLGFTALLGDTGMCLYVA